MCFWRISDRTNSPSFKKAKEAAIKAIGLDPSSPVAITNMAEILDNEYNFVEAEEKIQMALKIAPDNPYVLRNAGRFYTTLGREEESTLYCKKALQNDPYNKTAFEYLFDSYYYAGKYSDARETTYEFNDLGYPFDCQRYFRLLLAENDLDAILAYAESERDDNCYKIALAAANFLSDNNAEAENIINDLLNYGVAYYLIAFAYSFGENKANTMLFLEKSYSACEKYLTYIKVDPAFKNLRNEPQFLAIINKMNFPE